MRQNDRNPLFYDIVLCCHYSTYITFQCLLNNGILDIYQWRLKTYIMWKILQHRISLKLMFVCKEKYLCLFYICIFASTREPKRRVRSPSTHLNMHGFGRQSRRYPTGKPLVSQDEYSSYVALVSVNFRPIHP